MFLKAMPNQAVFSSDIALPFSSRVSLCLVWHVVDEKRNRLSGDKAEVHLFVKINS